MTSVLPERIGHFKVIRRIGGGAMGEVFLVKKEGESGFVSYYALKRLREDLSEDPDFVSALIREARIGGLLRHQNLVQIHELARIRNTYVVTMDYVDGADLSEIVRAQKSVEQQMAPRTALDIISQVADAIAYAHELTDPEGNSIKLIHRDLKPGNVRISKDGAIKVMDFGIARSDEGTQHTTAGAIKGTVRYMAPEQARGELDIGPSVDIYAMGTVLFEMLAQQHLYPQSGMLECLGAVQQGKVEGRFELVPEEFHPLLGRALSAEPTERIASARDFADEVRQLAGTLPAGEPFNRQLEGLVKLADTHKRIPARADGVVITMSRRDRLVKSEVGDLSADVELSETVDVSNANLLEPRGVADGYEPDLATDGVQQLVESGIQYCDTLAAVEGYQKHRDAKKQLETTEDPEDAPTQFEAHARPGVFPEDGCGDGEAPGAEEAQASDMRSTQDVSLTAELEKEGLLDRRPSDREAVGAETSADASPGAGQLDGTGVRGAEPERRLGPGLARSPLVIGVYLVAVVLVVVGAILYVRSRSVGEIHDSSASVTASGTGEDDLDDRADKRFADQESDVAAVGEAGENDEEISIDEASGEGATSDGEEAGAANGASGGLVDQRETGITGDDMGATQAVASDPERTSGVDRGSADASREKPNDDRGTDSPHVAEETEPVAPPEPVKLVHESVSRVISGEALDFAASTPGHSNCVVTAYWRKGSGTWSSLTLVNGGEHHDGTASLGTAYKPEVEYYLAVTGCGTGRWPASGYQAVRVY